MIVGMVTPVKIDPTDPSATMTVSNIIKNEQLALRDYSQNLFGLHNMLTDLKATATSGGFLAEFNTYYGSLINYINVAIAGFSFFIIAIVSMIPTTISYVISFVAKSKK